MWRMDTTMQQIDCKLYDARKRISEHVSAACEATSEDDYAYALSQMEKATSDYVTWHKVWVALGGK